jgi:ATP-dependent 26S proteasome regulatory subunit
MVLLQLYAGQLPKMIVVQLAGLGNDHSLMCYCCAACFQSCAVCSYLILDTLPAEYDSRVKAMEVDEKPTEDYSDIGGLDKQIQVQQQQLPCYPGTSNE